MPPTSAPLPVVARGRTRSALVVVGSILTVLALLATSFRLLSYVARDDYEVTHTLSAAELSPIDTVDVTNHGGDVHITVASTDDATVRLAVTDGLVRATREVELEGETLRIETGCGWFVWRGVTHCRVDQDLTVPDGLPMTIRGRYGDVRLTGSSAAIDLDRRFGDVELIGLSGPTTIDHGFGSVTGRELRTDALELSNRFGESTLRFATPPSEVRIDNRFGDTLVEVPADGATYQVRIDSSFGDRRIEVATDTSSDRVIDITSSFGDVTVRYASDTTGG